MDDHSGTGGAVVLAVVLVLLAYLANTSSEVCDGHTTPPLPVR